MDVYDTLSLVIACVSALFTGAMFVYDVNKNKAELTLQVYGAGSCGRLIRLEIINVGNRIARNIKIKDVRIENNTYNFKKKGIDKKLTTLKPFDLAPHEYYSRDIGSTDGTCDAILDITIKYNKFMCIKRKVALQNNKMTLNGIANQMCNISTGIEKISKDKEDK